jgi:hypothetical protein
VGADELAARGWTGWYRSRFRLPVSLYSLRFLPQKTTEQKLSSFEDYLQISLLKKRIMKSVE